MRQKKTLVVILTMHRCGSSLTARLLQRLGMSLGPFDLGQVNEWNKYGHFEAEPFVQLNTELQGRQFGFDGDMPDSAENLRRFLASDGRWDSPAAFDEATIARGRDLVEQLMQWGDVCGFKDPRTALVWPFWQQVFTRLPDLRIVPLFLLRGPHEIAMSIFRRLPDRRDYREALDVTAVHYHRMKEIRDQWPGPTAVVRFDPEIYGVQARHAAELCGLRWSDAALAECYDASCRHYEATVIDHPAQAAYEALAGLPPNRPGEVDARRLSADAAKREAVLRQTASFWQQQHEFSQRDNAILLHENDELRQVAATVPQLQAQLASTVPQLQAQLASTALDLELIRGSRTWRLRGALVSAFRLSRKKMNDPVTESR